MIAIITCLNNRPHVSPLIFECAKRLNKDAVYCHLIVGYTSEQDGELATSWANECPWVHPVGPIKNVPGHKWNEVLKYAYSSVTEFSGFVTMGDDDSMSIQYFAHLMNLDSISGHDFCGTSVNAFIEQKTGNAIKHVYTHQNKLIGAGRYISRNAIEKTCVRQPILVRMDIKLNGVTYSHGSREMVEPPIADYLVQLGYVEKSGDVVFTGLWPENAKQALDLQSELNLAWHGFIPRSIKFDDKIHIVDVKSNKDGSPANIHTFSMLQTGQMRNARVSDCTFEDATWFMNEKEKALCHKKRD